MRAASPAVRPPPGFDLAAHWARFRDDYERRLQPLYGG